MKNEVTINVKCKGTAVTITVDPFEAHALPGQPMVWRIEPNADVDALDIGVVQGIWPFRAAAPYRTTKKNPASRKVRITGWTSKKVRYKISGTCMGQSFVLDPDMIVD